MNSRLRLFDTDMLSLVQRRHPLVTNHLKSHSEKEVAITIVTVEEQLKGWLSQLNRERKLERIVHTYSRFQAAVLAYGEIVILPFDHNATKHFQRLKKLQTRIGVLDLRIASIALAFDAILVTANTQDYQQVPGLTIEDWTLASV